MKNREAKSESRINRSIYAYDLVNRWIENADNKVSISCAVFTGSFGVITFLSGTITATEEVNQSWRNCYHISLITSVILLLIAILYYVLSINPNLGKSGAIKNNLQKKKSPLFYGDIEKLSLQEYKNIMNRSTDEDLIDELQTETHYNSGICIAKMKRYRFALWFSFAAIVMSIVSGAARYMMYR